jgi:hypothetical protein
VEIIQAQKDVRETYMGGFAGQLVSGAVWAASAAACTWHSLRLGEWVLILGGFFIFSLTQLLLRAMGHAYALPRGHPMNALGIQIAFSLPPTLLLAIAIAAFYPAWFYPAVMIALGAHYLPFIFMYGMWQYGVLAAALIASGVAIAEYPHSPVSLGAWLTAAVLFVFALVGVRVARSESSAS